MTPDNLEPIRPEAVVTGDFAYVYWAWWDVIGVDEAWVGIRRHSNPEMHTSVMRVGQRVRFYRTQHNSEVD